mgnify:CR=1 FL=1
MKKKYSALPELLLRSIFYTLINYVLLSMVLSFRLHWSSILFSAAMLWFALDYSKTIQQLTGKRLLADPFMAWLHSHQHIYCILCRVHSRLVRIILTKKTGAVGRTYSFRSYFLCHKEMIMPAWLPDGCGWP